MKKVISLVILFGIIFGICLIDGKALSIYNISYYENILDEINKEYNSYLYILSEKEFEDSEIKEKFYNNYKLYIENICSIDINEFRKENISVAKEISEYNVDANVIQRSTLTTKTVYFNYSRNTMTLKYRYSGTKYDTSYKPTATVSKVNSQNYFVMSSYTGSFKNSNTTYAVVAKGKIYTSMGVAGEKTFTINFNL